MSSWEKEAPVQQSQESSQKPTAAKPVLRNKSVEELHPYEGAASEDNGPSVQCTVCRMKEAALFIKVSQ